jgi:hypothetical protein
MADIYPDILRTAEAALKALNLQGLVPLHSAAANVVVRKLPAVEEELDMLPMLCVVPSDEDEEIARADFEGGKFCTHKFDVAFIAKGRLLPAAEGNADPNSDLYRQLGWRKRVRDLFFDPVTFLSVGRIKGTTVKPGRPVDRNKVNQNYDYSIISVEVRTQE